MPAPPVGRATVAACFPPLAALLTEIEQTPMRQAQQRAQAEADRQAAETARQAEQQRQAAENARKMQAEANRKRQAEEAEHDRVERAWFAEASKPRNVLVNAYRNYIAVRQCAASREGYAIVYVVPERLEQARAEIQAIEAKALRQDPSIDKGAAWQEANGPDRLPDPDATPTDQMLGAMGRAAVEAHAYNDQGQRYCETAAYVVDQLAKAADPAGGAVRKDF